MSLKRKSFKEAAGSLSPCVIELGFGQLECATSFPPLWHGRQYSLACREGRNVRMRRSEFRQVMGKYKVGKTGDSFNGTSFNAAGKNSWQILLRRTKAGLGALINFSQPIRPSTKAF